jgi:putative endonuclease
LKQVKAIERLPFFMPHYVYILKSLKDNRYYIGETADVKARLDYHNSGMQRSTRNRIPFVLVYSEELNDRKEALQREKQIKGWKGGDAFKNLIRSANGTAW